MKNEFIELCESINTTLKFTKIYRYPRQIQFSEEFTRALSKEVSRHMQILDETQQPIRDLPEKFLKALKFELTELTESKTHKKSQMDLRPRQKWTINPETRIKPSKRGVYDRAKEKRNWSKE
ncbi:MAG: hypothetical protein WC905_03940 [Patescibacteria group bacterium]|jgi:hypothetical protein